MITRMTQYNLSNLLSGFCKFPLYATISEMYGTNVTDKLSSIHWFDVVGDELLHESIRRIETRQLATNPDDYFCREFNTPFKEYLNKLVNK